MCQKLFFPCERPMRDASTCIFSMRFKEIRAAQARWIWKICTISKSESPPLPVLSPAAPMHDLHSVFRSGCDTFPVGERPFVSEPETEITRAGACAMRSFLKPAAGVVCLVALACAGCSSGGEDASDAGVRAARTVGRGAVTESERVGVVGHLVRPVRERHDRLRHRLGGLADHLQPGLRDLRRQRLHAEVERDVRHRRHGREVPDIGAQEVRRRACGCRSAARPARSWRRRATARATLAKAYGAALDAAGSTQADFDVEGDQLTDSDSVARRSEAIALLQKERTDLTVSFTLPVMPSGLDADGLALLESANDHSVKVSTVNIMTMNYGSSYADDMGDYAITSAEAAHDQLKKVFGLSDPDAWQGLALTSMIGVNDVDNETFGLSDAAQVREFAEKKGVAWVSMWSSFRDQQCGEGDNTAATRRPTAVA